MASEGFSRKGRAQSTFWGRSKRKIRQFQQGAEWKKQNEEVAGIATFRRALDDSLLQSDSYIASNPYANEVFETQAVYDEQVPQEDVVDILDVDGPDEQNNSILSEGYSETKLITKAAKTLTIFFLFTAIIVCATISKLCFVAVTTQLSQTHPLSSATQPPGLTATSDPLSDNFPFNNMSDSGMDETSQLSNTTSDMTSEQPTTAANGTSSQRNRESIAFIQVVIVLMSPQLVTFMRMLFGGIIGKSSSTFPWPSVAAIVLVRAHTHTHTHTHTYTQTHTHTHTHTHTQTHPRTCPHAECGTFFVGCKNVISCVSSTS